MRKFVGAVMGALMLGAVFTGCSNSMTKDDFKNELVSQGMDAKTADCIVEGLNTKGFKFRKYGDLSQEETKQVTDVATDCALKSAGLGGSGGGSTGQ